MRPERLYLAALCVVYFYRPVLGILFARNFGHRSPM